MGREPGWGAVATGRPAMRSPGRPPVARAEHRRIFWSAIARGATSTDAGVEAGVSPVLGSRWFRECGGVTPQAVFKTPSGRYLSFDEREQIALLRAKNHGVREIAGEHITVEIAKRSELRTFKVMPKRWVVERSFAWLEKNRRLWKNCERLLNTSLQFIHLAFLALMLRRL